jgi:peptide chain release factor
MIAWLQVTSGRGPDECAWVVGRVVDRMVQEARTRGYDLRILDTVPGGRDRTYKSALLAVEGDDLSQFIAGWQGPIQWVGASPFRPHHKRKNWFVGVNRFSPPAEHVFRPQDLKFEVMRSSGPGGQHTNKTESAVRVTHLPTGLSAVAQEERSQHLNRSLALGRLYERWQAEAQSQRQQIQKDQWESHDAVERGNPVRTYTGPDFKPK